MMLPRPPLHRGRPAAREGRPRRRFAELAITRSSGCILRRADVSLRAELEGPPLPVSRVGGAEAERLLERAMLQQGLSARAHDRILKVARTIADLDGSSDVRRPHIAEALSYRRMVPGRTLVS